MKKYLLLLLAGSMMVLSCKKDRSKGNTPDDGGKPSTQKYAVNFTVGGGSTLSTAAVSGKLAVNDAATDTLKKYIRSFNYLVYDSKGALIRQINQIASSTANYGVISDLLNQGTYTVVFIANSKITVGAGLDNDKFTFDDPTKKDLFYKSFTLTITNVAINQQVTLNRMASQVQVVATDPVPNNIDSIRIFLPNDYNLFGVKNAYGDRLSSSIVTTVIGHKFTAAERGKANIKISALYFNVKSPDPYWSPVAVTILRYPQSIFKAPITINNVICEAGMITVLSGHVFDNFVYPGGFQISFDPVWSTQTGTF